MEDVPISWIAREAPSLIADILRGLSEPVASGELELPAQGIERIDQLGRLRPGDAALGIPRDLAALQTLLIEALRREVPERQIGAFAGSVERLAEIFGDIQAQVGERMVRDRSGGAKVDPLTGLPGTAELHEWMRILVQEQHRHGHPFSVMLIGVEGLAGINDAFGHEAGDRMLRAVAAVLARQLRSADRAFRLTEEEFCVLVPHESHAAAMPLAERICEVVDGSQAADGPRLTVAAGLASCPEHGDAPDGLLGAAEEAAWSAKAAGRPVAVASV